MRTPTELFVYGTLRHDQPEHGQFCRGVAGWRRARVRGRLFRLREGYPILVVRPEAMLLEASTDAVADEMRRSGLIRPAPITDPREDAEVWVDGEILTFPDAAMAWPLLDEWECFEPGAGGVYRRGVVAAEVTRPEGGWEGRLVWAYVTGSIPEGAAPVAGGVFP